MLTQWTKCVKCEKGAALKWTLYNGQTATVAALCMEHGAPLSDIVNIVGPKPPAVTMTIPKQSVRLPKARPLDWTPPED